MKRAMGCWALGCGSEQETVFHPAGSPLRWKTYMKGDERQATVGGKPVDN
jgi:hypothetical protein